MVADATVLSFLGKLRRLDWLLEQGFSLDGAYISRLFAGHGKSLKLQIGP
ncbi:MAG: hypothetical protein ABEH59_12415 [Halobacteriales archaeon]